MSNSSLPSILSRHMRADADVLRIAADAVTEAADALDAGGDRLDASHTLTRASLNAVVSVLSLARKAGQLDA